MIVLVGRKAQSAEPQILLLASLSTSKVSIKHTYYMSALVFNTSLERRRLIEESFSDIAKELSNNK